MSSSPILNFIKKQRFFSFGKAEGFFSLGICFAFHGIITGGCDINVNFVPCLFLQFKIYFTVFPILLSFSFNSTMV